MTVPTTTASTLTDTAVRLDDVTKAYRLGDGSVLTATDHVSLDLRRHEFTTLVGASGSGKSTLLHLIGSIDTPDSGTIEVDGRPITGLRRRDLADYRSTVGFVFQKFHLVSSLTVTDNILAPLVARRTDYDRRERAEEVLELVGLAERGTSLPSQLSGGQQQRVAIARALINHPRLVLADEPTGNLDSANAEQVLGLLLRLNQDLGATIVMATHDPSIADRSQRTVTVRDGRIDNDQRN